MCCQVKAMYVALMLFRPASPTFVLATAEIPRISLIHSMRKENR